MKEINFNNVVRRAFDEEANLLFTLRGELIGFFNKEDKKLRSRIVIRNKNEYLVKYNGRHYRVFLGYYGKWNSQNAYWSISEMIPEVREDVKAAGYVQSKELTRWFDFTEDEASRRILENA